MTDPVDTDALRDMGAALASDGHTFGPRIVAAADEVDRLRAGRGPGTVIRDFKGDDVWRDEEGHVWVRQQQLVDAVKFNVNRLRAVIESAPHAAGCDMATPDFYRMPTDRCTCWKADAL